MGYRVSIGDLRLSQSAKDNLDTVIRSGRVTEHKMVRRFEDAWADYIGVDHCVAVSSGWGALVTALSAAKIMLHPPTDAVLTTPLSYIATTSAIWLADMYPVFDDVSPDTMCIQRQDTVWDIALPVDLMGYASDIPDGTLAVIEDAAEAHGTVAPDGKKCGARSLAGCFSFYVAHNVQAGEMGCITTDNKDFAQLCRQLKAQGRACKCRVCIRGTGHCPDSGPSDPRFRHEYPGFNFKSNEFAAAIALSQANKADIIKQQRLDNVQYLSAMLANTLGIHLPYLDDRVSYMAYPLILDDNISRKDICWALENLGIETRPLFGVVYQHPAWHRFMPEYRNLDGCFPVAERLGSQGFYIGCHQYLTTDDLKYAAEAIKEILSKYERDA